MAVSNMVNSTLEGMTFIQTLLVKVLLKRISLGKASANLQATVSQ
jgi:hypothetical protein